MVSSGDGCGDDSEAAEIEERRAVEGLPLVRRVLHRSEPLEPAPVWCEDRGEWRWGRGENAQRLRGPCRVSGGWWVREVERDYYYLQREDGALWWVFLDRARKRWMLYGMTD